CRGKHVAELVAGLARPLAIQRRDFRRDDHPIGADVILERFANHALAVAVAVGECRFEEGDDLIDRLAHRLAPLVVIDADPHGIADATYAIADFALAIAGFAE